MIVAHCFATRLTKTKALRVLSPASFVAPVELEAANSYRLGMTSLAVAMSEMHAIAASVDGSLVLAIGGGCVVEMLPKEVWLLVDS